jgi:hypothetical protein
LFCAPALTHPVIAEHPSGDDAGPSAGMNPAPAVLIQVSGDVCGLAIFDCSGIDVLTSPSVTMPWKQVSVVEPHFQTLKPLSPWQ